MEKRIVSIQHGDYAEAIATISQGKREPYFGMEHTIDVLESLFSDVPHLVLSLNTKKAYSFQKANAKLIGLERFIVPRPIPMTVAMYLNARRICKTIEAFKPTHVLIRTGGIYALKILEYCIENNLNTLVIFANTFDNPGIINKFINKKIVRLLNHPCVYRVANHKQPATDSMTDLGVDKIKSLAWDWPNARHPSNFCVKKLKVKPRNIVYVGAITYQKGISDLVDAVSLLFKKGNDISLTIVGDGIDIDRIKEHAGTLLGEHIIFIGRVDNDHVFQIMLESDLVCIPSRHVFTEGMPLTLTEALASRSPVVISDHPVFKRAFVEEQGVRFFPEKESAILAEVIRSVFSDASNYEKLSRTTEEAFERVECKITFGDVIEQWKATFN